MTKLRPSPVVKRWLITASAGLILALSGATVLAFTRESIDFIRRNLNDAAQTTLVITAGSLFSFIGGFLMWAGAGRTSSSALPQRQLDKFKEPDDSTSVIARSIEFPSEWLDAGVSVLGYFSHILRVKYPELNVRVALLQEDLKLTMIVYMPNGDTEKVVRTLDQYGMVLAGRLDAESLLADPIEVMALKSKLELAQQEVRQAYRMLDLIKETSKQRIDSLEDKVKNLYQLIDKGLQSGNAAIQAFAISADSGRATYNLSNPIFGGDFIAKDVISIGDVSIDLLSPDFISNALASIQRRLTDLEEKGISDEEAQSRVAHEIAQQSLTNPNVKGKIARLRHLLTDNAAKATVSEAVKTVIRLALRLSGIPLV